MNRQKIGQAAEVVALIMVLASIVALVFESDAAIAEQYQEVFALSRTVFAVFFVGEYILRSVNTQREGLSLKSWRRYSGSFFGVIDLLSILPVILPMLVGPNFAVVKTFRMLRVFRILKFGRYSKSMKMLGDTVMSIRYALLSTLFIAAFIILFSSACMFYLEHEAQPEAFPNILSTLWWAVATLTTVGYGDIYPVTAGGKLFASIVAMVGIGLVAIPTGLMSAAFVSKIEEYDK